MTREDFFKKCDAVGITGSTEEYTSKLLWCPETKSIIRIMYDTSGDQLMSEDIEEGYNDYIDYKVNEFDPYNGEEVFFNEGDGGLYLFDHENSDIQQRTWEMLEQEIFYGREVPEVIWLKTEE